jgi:hypothetical protein
MAKRKRSDNTMAKRKRSDNTMAKRKGMICKTLHKKLKIEQNEPH